MEILNPTYDDIHNGCRKIVKIINDIQMDVGLVIGLSRGGLVPGVIISHMLESPFLAVEYSSKHGAGDNKDHKNILPEIKHLTDKYILVADDIADTGRTLQEVMDFWKPNDKLYSCVLYYKQLLNPDSYKPDFHWRMIPHNSNWIQFPWENK